MPVRRKLLAVLAAVVAASALVAVAAPSAQARIFYLGASSFSPAYAEDGSGVGVTFINGDSAAHRVVSYRISGSQAWSLDVTLAPHESYTVPNGFYCVYPSCGYSATYLFRVPEKSQVVVGWGYSYCTGYCGELVVHR